MTPKQKSIILASIFSGVMLGFAIWLACILSISYLDNRSPLTQSSAEQTVLLDHQ